MSSTRVSRHVNAPPARVYSALVDANAIAAWMVPTGMTSHVRAFEGREGGTFRISLTYDTPTGVGKTTAHTDTFHGRFVKLVPNERVVEAVEFETADPRCAARLRSPMQTAAPKCTTDYRAACRPPTTSRAGDRRSRSSPRSSRRPRISIVRVILVARG